MKKLFEKNELKHLWPMYAYYLIVSFTGIIFPYMFIYFVDAGFTYFHIAVLLGIFNLSMILFEIPTGAIADSYSRKKSVIAGALISGLCFASIYFISSFEGLILVFIIIGIAMTLTSGAESAWIVSNLKKLKQEKLIDGFFMKAQIIRTIVSVLSALLGVYLIEKYSMRPLWLLVGFGFIVSGIILEIFLKELMPPKKHNFKKANKEHIKLIKRGFKLILNNKNIFYIILSAGIINMTHRAGDYYEVLIVETGLPVQYLGYFIAIVSIISAFGMIISKHFKNYNKTLINNLIISSILFVITIFVKNLFAVAIIYILFFSINIINYPILQIITQRSIEEKTRATVTSIQSMITNLMSIMMGLIVGAVANISTLALGISTAAIVSLLGILVVRRIKEV